MELYNNRKFVFLNILSLCLTFLLPAVKPTRIEPDLECLKQIESSDGLCFYDNGCCHRFNTDRCRRELTRLDIHPLRVTFINGSLSFDRANNRLCIQGLEPSPNERLSDLYGVVIFVRKERITSPNDEVVSMNFMFQHIRRKVVEKDTNPLDSLLMCLDLGYGTIDSFSPDTFVTVEMITLRPIKGEPAVVYPGGPQMLCNLDSIEIQRTGDNRCQVESVNREPHSCNSGKDYVVEDPIDSEEKTEMGHNEEELLPKEDYPISSTKPPVVNTGREEWTTMELVLIVTISVFMILGCVIAGVLIFNNCSRKRSKKFEAVSTDGISSQASNDNNGEHDRPDSQCKGQGPLESSTLTSLSQRAAAKSGDEVSDNFINKDETQCRNHSCMRRVDTQMKMSQLVDQEGSEGEQLLGGDNVNVVKQETGLWLKESCCRLLQASQEFFLANEQIRRFLGLSENRGQVRFTMRAKKKER